MSFAVSSNSEMSREMEALGLDGDVDVQVGLYDSTGKYAMTDDFRYTCIAGLMVLMKSPFCTCIHVHN